MATAAAMSGVPYALQSAATVGNGNIVAPPPSFRNHTLLVTSAAGTTAGVIQPETSNDNADAGTWAPIGGGPVTVPAASSDLVIEFTGLYRFIRARITTTVSGGGAPSINVDYLGSHL